VLLRVVAWLMQSFIADETSEGAKEEEPLATDEHG